MPEFWEVTQQKLQPLIQKPKLTEKLLNKPPFRFIHDLVMAVVKNTGFAQGLYDEKESDHTNIKDKAGKIAFLSKIINCVGIAMGEKVPADPLKIVAGHEAEKTNVLFQLLAQGAADGVDTSDAVARVNAGETQDSAGGAAPKKAPSSSRSSKDKEDKPAASSRSSKERPSGERKSSERSSRREKPSKEVPAEKPADAPKQPAPSERPERPPPDKKTRDRKARPAAASGDRTRSSGAATGSGAAASADRRSSRRDKAPSGAAKEEDATGRDGRPARPMTARRAPPKQQSNVRTIEKKDVAPSNEKEGKATSGLIIDGEEESESEEEIIEDEPSVDMGHTTATDDQGDGQHGALVKGMLESAQALEDKANKDTKRSKHQDDALNLERHRRGQDRESTQKEVEKLRDSLQKLTKSTNPVGKCMDYVQEDIETMARELEKWREVNKNQSLKVKQKATDSELAIAPLREQLHDLEQEILVQVDKIKIVKSSIAENDQTIQNLLRMVVSSHR
eukprot:TRINITY_DN2776_c1_g1_i5.p1 TRINITY_DN2776_c1_g1~~TRINITY_DN2776_c1_g1_i5.p1  ORF type:complete len:507 (-),score=159.82 TRINITY_DN2776_c1_g1_i5:231-1751(-)